MANVDIGDLKNINSIEKLTAIFTHRLNYQYEDSIISTRRWKEDVINSIFENDIKLLAKHEDFHIIYCRIESLRLGIERLIVNQLLREHPYLLVIFSDKSNQNYHLVNVKYDEEIKNRRLFRRIVIGPDERLHTAAERINRLEISGDKIGSLEVQNRHDTAFDVEEVTKQFFDKFTDIFHLLSEDIEEENPACRGDCEAQAQLILNRLMFLYFIQKKGWLNNNPKYLYEKFLAYYKKDQEANTFYSQFLIKLCQELSSQAPLFKELLGDVPFLNGGLFEIDPFTSKLPFKLHIKNSTFKKIFDELLEKFNFTVREDTPLDVEVAIDPEMLGKVFENLILKLEKGEDLQKKTGSYYTPRVIVHFMCQESLKGYLITESGIERTKIEELFKTNPPDQLTEEEMKSLGSLLALQQARLLKNLIKKAYILDPAVGSGAFLVGMLHEMISIVKLLDGREFGKEYTLKVNYDYELKRQLIENCLYGVDIQEEAVRICELRLWLSLIVDYEKVKGEDVPPLPNLSYRIRCGDSIIEKLFGHNLQLDQLVSTDKGRQLIDEIKETKEAYFLSRSIREKNKTELSILAKQCELLKMLVKAKKDYAQKDFSIQPDLFGLTAEEKRQREERKKQIEKYNLILSSISNTSKKVDAMLKGKIPIFAEDIHELKKKLGISFIWKLDFAEVFKEKSGFDVVIANPPYVSFGLRDVGKAKGEWADYMRMNYPNSAEYKLSIYAIFMDKGIQLLKDKGVLSYITPDSFLLGRYFSKLRSFVLHSCFIKEIVMFEKDFWEGGVVGRPVISNIQKNLDIVLKRGHHITSTVCTTIEKFHRGALQSYSYEQKYFETVSHNKFRLFFDKQSKDFVDHAEKNSLKLGEIVSIHTGVRSKIGQENIVSKAKNGPTWHKGLVSGSEVIKYAILYEGNFININPKLLWSGGWDPNVILKEKLLLRQTGDSLIVAFDDNKYYHLNNIHSIVLKDDGYALKYILALLNSKLLNHYYHLISLELGRTMAQTDIETIEQLPIKLASENVQKEIINLVDKVIAAYNKGKYPVSSEDNDKAHEFLRQIDQKVYELYGLTDKEIKLVEETAR